MISGMCFKISNKENRYVITLFYYLETTVAKS